MKARIIVTCMFALSMTACKKFLEITPETALSSATFFTQEADFKQAVNGAYVPLRAIVNSVVLLAEMHSDNLYYYRNILFGATEQQENISDFSVPTANGITTNAYVRAQYRQDYQIIARTNQVLSTIDKIEFSSDSLKNNLKGQALFLRAYAYFELVRYFGKVPLHLTPVTGRSDAALPLASEEELYAQIIKDATDAATMLLPKSKQEPGRATSGAAKTLLANAYIMQKKWAEAESILKEVVSSNEYALMPEYADAFSGTNSNKNNIESVFEVQFQEGAAGYGGSLIYNFIPRPITASELQPITGTSNPQDLSGEGNNAPTPDIIAAYEAGDKRKDASIAYVTLSGSLRDDKVYPYVKKYAKPHSTHGVTGNNFPIYRYSEILLFLAEALNEQGKTAEAAIYLNQVRTRAGLAPSAAPDLREAIYNERRVELAFENKRWFDLVRSGKAVDVITAYGNRVKSNPQAYYYPVGAVPPNNAFTNLDLVYGLPADEAALNPNF